MSILYAVKPVDPADPADPVDGHAAPRPQRGPRRIRVFTAEDWWSLVGGLASAFALVVVGYLHILDFSGLLGFLVSWYLESHCIFYRDIRFY